MTDHEKRIREALEAGPTDGPFITFGDQVYRATDPDLTTPVASWNTAGFTMEGVSIDALYYAACNPAAIRALLADLDAMRGALEKISGLGMSQFFKPYDMAEEAQNIARAALSEAKAGGWVAVQSEPVAYRVDWPVEAGVGLRPQAESDARRAAQEQLYTERERHTAEVKRLQAEIGRLQSLRPQVVPMTDELANEFAREMVKGHKSVEWLVRKVEAHRGITAQGAQGGEVQDDR